MANKSEGYMPVSQQVKDTKEWGDAVWMGRFLDLVFMAAYKPKTLFYNGQEVDVERGEVIVAQHLLWRRWEVTRRTLRAFLRHLVQCGVIHMESVDRRYTRIKIRVMRAQGTNLVRPQDIVNQIVEGCAETANGHTYLNKINKKIKENIYNINIKEKEKDNDSKYNTDIFGLGW